MLRCPRPSPRSGLELYFRRADTFAEGDGIRGELYVSTCGSQSDPWGLAEKLAAPINLPGFDQNEPSISMFDGLELYFNSTRPEDDGQDIYFARRATPLDPFGEPELFRPVSGSPFLSADGLKFFFVTPVLETLGADDFYVMTRDTPDGEFGVPIHLAGISSSRGRLESDHFCRRVHRLFQYYSRRWEVENLASDRDS